MPVLFSGCSVEINADGMVTIKGKPRGFTFHHVKVYENDTTLLKEDETISFTFDRNHPEVHGPTPRGLRPHHLRIFEDGTIEFHTYTS